MKYNMKQLQDYLKDQEILELVGSGNPEISAITFDSRKAAVFLLLCVALK